MIDLIAKQTQTMTTMAMFIEAQSQAHLQQQQQAAIDQSETNDLLRELINVIKDRPVQVQVQKEVIKRPVDVSSGHQKPRKHAVTEDIYTQDKIVEKGKEYTRKSHKLLFSVIDWLEANPDKRSLGVRKIAEEFTASTKIKVSKSWAAVAKEYWKNNQ